MSVGNRNFIASWGYRGLPIATSTEKRQRLISAPDGVEERNTLRTSEESEAETKRPPINQNSHLTQNLASDANLACSGKGFAPGASYCT
jgi:hypothetical protein